jgi:hypothetical protein
MNIGIERIFSSDRNRFIAFAIDLDADGVYRFTLLLKDGTKSTEVFEAKNFEQAEAIAADVCRRMGL